jgi:hypothetical protein
MPILGMLDPERDFVHPGGVRGCLSAFSIWAMGALMFQLLPPPDRDPDGEWERRWRRRLDAEPWILDLIRHGPGHPIWRERVIDAGSIQTPAFVVGGWRDLFCDATLRAFEAIEAPKELLMGPWMHTLPTDSPFDSIEFSQLAIRWWDRWLDAKPTNDGRHVALFRMGDGRGWQSFRTWPPDHDTLELVAARSLTLLSRQDARREVDGPGSVVRSVVPGVGALSGLVGLPTRGFGLPLNQHADDLRSISFTSAPLTNPVEIIGRPKAEIDLEVLMGVLPGVVVKVADVDPAGESKLITSGVAQCPVVNGSRGLVRVLLAPTDYRLKAGHSIRLVIAGSDFPRLWPQGPSVLAVYCGERSTYLRLPVAPRDAQPIELAPSRPVPTRPGLVVDATPEWSVLSDIERDRVVVTIADHVVADLPGERGRLQIDSRVTAEVEGSDPSTAYVHGTYDALMRGAGGEETTVRVTIDLPGDGALAVGAVEMDGEERFRRSWQAEVPGGARTPRST